MFVDWLAALKEPWTRPLRVPAKHTADKARLFDPVAFCYVDPGELLREVCWRARERAAKRNVAIFVHCASGPVRAQPTPFAEVLFRLLDNAVTATRSSPVLISVREGAEGDTMWQIQGNATLRVRHALAHAVVTRHGGLLRFDSTPDLGARASVWIPR